MNPVMLAMVSTTHVHVFWLKQKTQKLRSHRMMTKCFQLFEEFASKGVASLKYYSKSKCLLIAWTTTIA